MATRTDLLNLRTQVRRASEGRELLSDKRVELLKAFREVADTVVAESDALARAAGSSRATLALAEGLDGPEALRSAAMAARREITLDARRRVVMGVPIAEIERADVVRARGSRGYALSTSSARVDAVADSFETQLQLLVKIASEELRLRRLASELRKVTRRVNALEHVVLPRLEGELRSTLGKLEERDREDRFRLQRVKARSRRLKEAQ